MKPRERILTVLNREVPDRVPRFEIWIDALQEELGQDNGADLYVELGQDCIMLPGRTPPTSNAWRDGVDEWGRVWRNGTYVDGVLNAESDLEKYTPPTAYAAQFFDAKAAAALRRAHPDHCLIYGTHIGPFMAGYMAMGFERFFFRLLDDPAFIHRLLQARSDWCIAQFQQAIELGAEIIVMGDDAAHRDGPMISPDMWRQFILPYHRQIVEALPVPVIWHSDGDITSLLPMATAAGFVGVHGLEPAAGIDLPEIKQAFGSELILIGNIDVNVLFQDDLEAVRAEVRRSIAQGAGGGGFMLATCNSIFEGMNARAVAEMFEYQAAAVDVYW